MLQEVNFESSIGRRNSSESRLNQKIDVVKQPKSAFHKIEVISTKLDTKTIPESSFKSKSAQFQKDRARLSGSEFIYLVANRLYYSQAYTILYFTMIVANGIVLLWLLYTGGVGGLRILLTFEILTTIVLALEVFVKMFTQLQSYWSRPSNWFDFFILTLCIASIVIFETSVTFSDAELVDSMMQSVLLIVRYLIQGLRLFMLLRQQRRMAELTAGIGQNFVDDIDFTIFDPDIDMIKKKDVDIEVLERQQSSESVSSLSSWESNEGFTFASLSKDAEFTLNNTHSMKQGNANTRDRLEVSHL